MWRFAPSLWILTATAAHAGRKRVSETRLTEVPTIESVVRAEGFEPTLSQSDIYQPGSVLVPNGRGSHDKVVADCVEVEAEVAHMSQSSIATSLSAGVSARLAAARGEVSGGIEKRLSFVNPEQRTIPLAALRVTEACRSGIDNAARFVDLSEAVLVYDVLVAQVQNTVCTKADAGGRVMLLGQAEAAAFSECVQESNGLVPLGYKAVSLSKARASLELPVPTPSTVRDDAAPSSATEPVLPTTTRDAAAFVAAGSESASRLPPARPTAAVPLDAVSLYEDACAQGDAAACRGLGNRYREGDRVAQDPARAAGLYQKACEGGDAGGCTNLGLCFQTGAGVAPDLARAAALYERACLSGDPVGCANLGLSHQVGAGVPQDATRAAALYGQACSGGVARGCTNLGMSHYNGAGVARDLARASGFFAQACVGGDPVGCTNLGVAHQHGAGVPRDPARAAQLFDQGCSGGDARGCLNLSQCYEEGLGIGPDPQTARSLRDKACVLDAQLCGAPGSR